ncbi:hypothetical protein [Branchiibius sp. NY16-3462-2]|uniref:hypothetical protein n=1 Tax=Branchiibius sp. NY16-3462-2 TaxID=1807500 RepID=UPI0007959354|nr:hypothetical protein [Branchiibius sp. NY16-3462-2]KYH45013.1 hypothetical protein AZH51_14075 [Branchiibius sp. NY16-3462-2]
MSLALTALAYSVANLRTAMTWSSFSYGESGGSVVVDDGVGLAEVDVEVGDVDIEVGGALEDVAVVVLDGAEDVGVAVGDAAVGVDELQPVNARTPTPHASAATVKPCFIPRSPPASTSRTAPYVADCDKPGIACEKR